MPSEQPTTEQRFPRSYRVDARARCLVNALLLAFTALFLYLTVRDLARVDLDGTSIGKLIVVDLAVALFATWLGSAYNKRVILHKDAVEVAGWLRSRKLSFAEIRGRQTSANSRLPLGYAHIFVPSDKSKRELVLPPFLQTDQIFRDWIRTIPKIRR